MADNDAKNNELEQEFTFKRLATMSPAFAGAGISAYRIAKDLPKSIFQTTASPNVVSDFIKDIGPYASKLAGVEAQISDFVDYASNLTNMTMQKGLLGTHIRQEALNPNDVIFAWSQAAQQLPTQFSEAISPSNIGDPFFSMRNIFTEHLPRFSPMYRKKFMNVF